MAMTLQAPGTLKQVLETMAKEKRTHLKLLKLEAFLRIKYPEALAEYNVWWEISRQLEEAVGETK